MLRRKKADIADAIADSPVSSTDSGRSASKKRAPSRRRAASPLPPSSEADAGRNGEVAPARPLPEPEAVAAETPPALPPALAANAVGVTAVASTVTLDPGLSAIEISILPMQPYALGQVSLPLIWLSQPTANERDRLKILTASGREDNWLPPPGDLIVVRSPPAGGQLTVTVFGPPGQPLQAASIAVRRLSHAEFAAPAAAPLAATPARAAREKEVRLEVVAHIERLGDKIFPGSGWVGSRGSRLRIEGFTIRPLDELAASDLEYRAVGPDGRESPWTRSPQFCGARGRRLRLTGFAVRVLPRLQDRITVEYFGAFFDSGISGPFKNGQVCRPLLPGDTLEAINVRLIQRG